jgi:hypothetical protein
MGHRHSDECDFEIGFSLLLRKEHLKKEKLSKAIRSRQKNENEDMEWYRCSGDTT